MHPGSIFVKSLHDRSSARPGKRPTDCLLLRQASEAQRAAAVHERGALAARLQAAEAARCEAERRASNAQLAADRERLLASEHARWGPGLPQAL